MFLFVFQFYIVSIPFSFNLFFLDGLIFIQVNGENKKICLEDVLQFLTGKRIIPPGDETVIEIEFIKATKDGIRRPVASTCHSKVIATLTEEYETMREVWTEAVAQLASGFTLN